MLQHTVNSAQNAVLVLPLIRRLCGALEKRGVRYVHWKSNVNIARALAGADDLDLLVNRTDANSFFEALNQFGFKEVSGTQFSWLPGVRHFYGYDTESTRVVHVHLHFQLVLGNDLTKNYHLPLETALIDSALRDHLLPTPTPDFELVVYTIRMVLKFGFFQNPLGSFDRSGGDAELDYLQGLSDRAKVHRILKEHLPYVDVDLFDACLDCLRVRASSWIRWRLRGRLHAALSAHARRSRFADGWLKFSRRCGAGVTRRIRSSNKGKWLNDGGAMIAIVGGDGSGKTTLVQQIREHFAGTLATMTIHMGKPRRSFATRALDAFIRLDKLFGRFLSRDCGAELSGRSGLVSMIPALRQVCTARDRYLTYACGRRHASAGEVVISDRWPLPFLKRMDAPQLERPPESAHESPWFAALRSCETRYYNKVVLPDVLIVLRVPPDVAVARKTTEDPQSVRFRSQEVWECDWSQVNAHVIDAKRSLAEIVSDVIALVWRNL